MHIFFFLCGIFYILFFQSCFLKDSCKSLNRFMIHPVLLQMAATECFLNCARCQLLCLLLNVWFTWHTSGILLPALLWRNLGNTNLDFFLLLFLPILQSLFSISLNFISYIFHFECCLKIPYASTIFTSIPSLLSPPPPPDLGLQACNPPCLDFSFFLYRV